MWRYAGMADRIVTIRWPTPSAWVVVASEDAVAGGARWAVAAAVAVLALAACTATKSTGQRSTSTSPTATSSSPASGGGATSSSSSAAPAPARVTLLPASGTAGVSPIAPISASVSGGTLTSVTLTNDDGTGVIGTMAADRTSWTAGQPLGYGKRYTLTARATNGAGDRVTKTSAFGTVTPGNMTMAYINTAAGYALNPARTYGVGQAIKVHFDEPIRNKAAAERALSVTTVPAQVGGWNWFSDQDVHWRPKVYFAPHTRVTVTAKIYGVQVGPGLYGQADTSTSFRIGEAQISKVNDSDKIIRVYRNGVLMRQMPTSMGKGGTIAGTNGQKISLWTNSGLHTVVDAERNITMTSGSFGVPDNSPQSYRVSIPYGVRISMGGEFIHWADWSVPVQGRIDTSHGCLNVSPANSVWFYKFTQPGDIVDVEGTPQRLHAWDSGDWTVAWATWQAGSALH
jgi:lipoprotein-anchoring transpeptidase ErfK/SrfK